MPNIDRDAPADAARAKEIDGYLRTCCSAVESEGAAEFINSIARQWDRGRVLTEKQYQALKRIHDEL